MTRLAGSNGGVAEGEPGGTQWFVYVLISPSINATYVGISIDVQRRLQQHNGGLPGGARATRRGRPWQIATSCGPLESRGAALQLEYRIKTARGLERIRVVEEWTSCRHFSPS
ncbi:GIY-YIG nuclease family protein [bacterium]|nr:GIY-YIG nuclease family protein [bacterium]